MNTIKLLSFTVALSLLPLHNIQAQTLDETARIKELEDKVARLEAVMGNVDDYINHKVEQRVKDELAQGEQQIKIVRGTWDSAAQDPNPEAVTVKLTPGLKVERQDKKHSFAVGGRLQVDGAYFDDDLTDQPDGTVVRRARLNVGGHVFNDWVYKAEYDFANDSTALKDAYIGYAGLDGMLFRLGHTKEPLTMDTMTSSLHGLFIERSSAATIFHPVRNIGIDGRYVTGHWHLQAGAYADGSTSSGSNDDEQFSVTGRLVFAPVAEKDAVLHFGVSGSYREPDRGLETVQYRERPENAVQSDRFIDTGAISEVDSYTVAGLELAASYKPVWLQAEYLRSDISREDGNPDARFDSYYAQLGYILTGESRPYSIKSATFGRLKPNAPLSSGNGWGAFELGARYSHVDLNDASAGITGGEMDNYTVGLNWYPEDNLKFQVNYIKVETDSQAVVANDDPSIALVRAQYDF